MSSVFGVFAEAAAGELAAEGVKTVGEAGEAIGEGAALRQIEAADGLPGDLSQPEPEIGELPSDMSELGPEIRSLPGELIWFEPETGELPDDMSGQEPETSRLPKDLSQPELEAGGLPGELSQSKLEGGGPPDRPGSSREAEDRPSEESVKPTDSPDTPGEKKPGEEGREQDEPEQRMEPPAKIIFKSPEGCDSGEFDRQVKDQEKGLNDMTLEDFLKNRENYKQNGRDEKEGNDAQQNARDKARADKVKEYRDQGMSRKEAEAKADEWMKDQAALHNPDQVAGGDPQKVDGVGDSKVNSSIGGQWGKGGLADSLEQQVRDYINENDIPAEDLGNIKMNVQLDVA